MEDATFLPNCSYSPTFASLILCHPRVLTPGLQLSRPSNDVVRRRQRLITRVARAVNGACPSARPYEVVSFGSTVHGLDASTSDLDLVLLDPDRPDGYLGVDDAASLPKVYNPRWLANVLRKSGFSAVQAIVHASVPIVKFSDGSINADLSVGESFGARNSVLISHYMHCSPVLRPLCLAIKWWAKSRHLCDPSGKDGPPSFSSYTLILLAIAYLQHLSQLPDLQAPAFVEEVGAVRTVLWTRPRSSARKSQVPAPFDTTFCAGAPPSWPHPPPLDLGAALKGFFAFYADFDFRAAIITVRSGQYLARARPSGDLAAVVDGLKDLACSSDFANREPPSRWGTNPSSEVRVDSADTLVSQFSGDHIVTQDPFITTRCGSTKIT